MKTENPFFLVSGPCVIDDEAVTLRIATRLKELTERLGIPFTFKASYDKANRTALTSFRGPGITAGLRVLAKVKATLEVPVLSDVHRISEVAAAAEVLDVHPAIGVGDDVGGIVLFRKPVEQGGDDLRRPEDQLLLVIRNRAFAEECARRRSADQDGDGEPDHIAGGPAGNPNAYSPARHIFFGGEFRW